MGRLLSAGVALLLGCGASSADIQARTAHDAAAEAKPQEPVSKAPSNELETLRSQLAVARSEVETTLRPARAPRARQRRMIDSPVGHGFDDDWDDSEAREHHLRAHLSDESSADRPLLTLYGDQEPSSDLIAASGDGSDTTLIGGEQTPEAHYRGGLELVQRQRFAKALDVFRLFSKLYPDHGYADNAVFWEGEIHFLQRKYEKALHAYKRLIKIHPGGNKIPDALYKMGLIYQGRGEPGTAKKYFQQLQKRFPHSAAARLASQEGRS